MVAEEGLATKQGLTLVYISAQLEPFQTHNSTPKTTLLPPTTP